MNILLIRHGESQGNVDRSIHIIGGITEQVFDYLLGLKNDIVGSQEQGQEAYGSHQITHEDATYFLDGILLDMMGTLQVSKGQMTELMKKHDLDPRLLIEEFDDEGRV
jgi:hypothetical protein